MQKTEKEKYLTLQEAAQIINPNYKPHSILHSMLRHVQCGNINAYYPDLAVVIEGEPQVIGKSQKPFFKESEVLNYVNNTRAKNFKKGNLQGIILKSASDIKEFSSIREAAKFLDTDYSVVYRAINRDKKIKGFSVIRT